MKLSSKKINEINYISFVEDVITERQSRMIGQTHWLDTPPDMWNKEEKELYDILNELEMKLKTAILKTIDPTIK